MIRIQYHPENEGAPWVCHVGRNGSIWYACTSLWKALLKFPMLAWKFRGVLHKTGAPDRADRVLPL